MRGQAEECCFTTCLILPSWSPGGSCSASFFSHGWLIAQLPSPFSALVQSPCSASALSLSPLPTLLCVLLPKNNRYIRAQRRRGCLVGSLSEPSSHFSMSFHPSASKHPICHLFPTLCLPHPVCPSQHFCPCAACPSSSNLQLLLPSSSLDSHSFQANYKLSFKIPPAKQTCLPWWWPFI